MLDSVPALIQWVDAAPVGASAVYAMGDAPPREIAVVVANLADQGLVITHRKRLVDRRFQFQVRRSSAPVRVRVAAPRCAPASAEAALLRIAAECARRSMPFPTNRELAGRCGLSDVLAVSYRLRKLVASGLIEVEDFGPYQRRVIRIVATGQATPRALIDGQVLV